MVGSRSTASANEVHEPILGPFAELRRHVRWVEIVSSHGVGKTSIGVGVREAGGDIGKPRHERPHLVWSKGTVEPDAQGLGVGDADPEGLGGLSGQGTTRHVDNSSGDDNGHFDIVLLEEHVDGEQGSLGIESIEDGLNEEKIATTLDERLHLILVCGHELLERDVSKCCILNFRGDRERSVGWPNSSSAKAPPASVLLDFDGSHLAELR
mmetsp:Transcript_34907/g.109132  ORF Transcript_34907/g.109132 Transcript_34907/m.109132 type:complete len:210 (+) Transcript_34907:2939-3568(+)